MPDPKTDYQLRQTQGDVEATATKIMQTNSGLTYGQAYIKAVRLLSSV